MNRKRLNCSRVIGNERIRRYEEGRRERERERDEREGGGREESERK